MKQLVCYLAVGLTLATLCFTPSRAQVSPIQTEMGIWYLMESFSVADQNNDDLLGLNEMSTFDREFVYYLHDRNLEENDYDSDNFLSKEEWIYTANRAWKYREKLERRELALLNAQYGYFGSAKLKYLLRHPKLTRQLMENFTWLCENPAIIESLCKEKKWLVEHPGVVEALHSNFRWLTRNPKLSQLIYDEKVSSNMPFALSSWEMRHMDYISEHPEFEKGEFPIILPPSRPKVEGSQPGVRLAINSGRNVNELLWKKIEYVDSLEQANEKILAYQSQQLQIMEGLRNSHAVLEQQNARLEQERQALGKQLLLAKNVNRELRLEDEEQALKDRIETLEDEKERQAKNYIQYVELQRDSIQFLKRAKADVEKRLLASKKSGRVMQDERVAMEQLQTQVKYLQSENQILSNARDSLSSLILKGESVNSFAKKQVDRLMGENQRLRGQLAEVQSQNSFMAKGNSSKTADLSRANLENENLHRQIEALENQNVAAQERIRQERERNKKLFAETKKLKTQMASLTTENEKQVVVDNSQAEQIAELEVEIRILQGQLNSQSLAAREEKKRFEQRLLQLSNKNIRYRASVDSISLLKREIAVRYGQEKSRTGSLSRANRNLNRRVDSLFYQNDALSSERLHLGTQVNRLLVENETLRSEAQRLTEKYRSSVAKLKAEKQAILFKNEELTEKNAFLASKVKNETGMGVALVEPIEHVNDEDTSLETEKARNPKDQEELVRLRKKVRQMKIEQDLARIEEDSLLVENIRLRKEIDRMTSKNKEVETWGTEEGNLGAKGQADQVLRSQMSQLEKENQALRSRLNIDGNASQKEGANLHEAQIQAYEKKIHDLEDELTSLRKGKSLGLK